MKLLNQEHFALKVRNKEINVERSRRKEQYERQLYQIKQQQDDLKFKSQKEFKRKDKEERYNQEVKAETEKHKLSEAIHDMFVKNQFDMQIL